MTLIEVSISLTIMAVVLTAMVASVQQEAGDLSSMVTSTARERQAQEMVQRIESELEFAAAATPGAFLQSPVTALSHHLVVDSSLGFPPSGVLLINPGGNAPDRWRYDQLQAGTNEMHGLDNKANCAPISGGVPGMPVFWAGSAFAIDNQNAPPANQFDGQALEVTGPVFFRGDGTGFSFRVPTDPTGGNNYFNGSGVTWGSSVEGAPSLEGWSAIDFRPEQLLTEAGIGLDINLDGDLTDEYDLGQLRMYSWDAFASGRRVSDVALGPAIVLQERCDYGGDMDGDGFNDPIFLWNGLEQSLSLRLTVFSGFVNEIPIIRRIQTTLFLRNGAVD